MTTKVLKEALQRVELWPEHAQAALADLAFEMDQELREGKYEATQAELAGIDRGIRAADEGRVHPIERLDALIAKHRPK